jgi:hypothetical protein
MNSDSKRKAAVLFYYIAILNGASQLSAPLSAPLCGTRRPTPLNLPQQ